MTFIKLLATAVGIVSAIALVVVGLVEAPWQLLLIGLLVALYGLQRQIWACESASQVDSALLPTDLNARNSSVSTGSAQIEASSSNNSAIAASDPQEAEGEELIYRGIRYRPSQSDTPPPPDEKVEGIYRGQPWER
ncbi:DUF4278 domain-containing protein [Leptolyngbya sp. CCNP1308]|uniref:DUF4278 domain-containing protein n=1 Tax=Leptolyngbya sp. CCNP1308 TaxID=3110255 RepID=UPI002B20C9B6|nr:DUF4278 domain-containing protein [Leptolyngbya sp. CCNP1308]MEA5450334.1 DUF4278 domain-containing protein [Leptolyngbya sp. CCNP1308]